MKIERMTRENRNTLDYVFNNFTHRGQSDQNDERLNNYLIEKKCQLAYFSELRSVSNLLSVMD